MSSLGTPPLKLLVVIASYGTENDKYLSRVLDEYRSLPFHTHIVVLSNIPKYVGDDVELRVGLPTRNPHSLPFGHKQVFAERISDYDLFIYSENDILITLRNIQAFLELSKVMPQNQVAGLFRFERDRDGSLFYPDVHWHYHWETRSVESHGCYTVAFFTNEHAASYILTKAQLRTAIRSGSFLCPPHRGKYDMLETAATDPFTQCGLRKMICISHLGDFLVHHLPDKYVGRLGLPAKHFEQQIEALMANPETGGKQNLLDTHPELKASRFGKNYYEPSRSDMISLVPANARNILSIGCGWGATEQDLAEGGRSVTAIPLDPTIAACALARGVNVIEGDLSTAISTLPAGSFDCLLVSNVLHLLEDPSDALIRCQLLLSPGATIVAAVPNLMRLPVQWKKFRSVESHQYLGNYQRSGMHLTSHAILGEWFNQSGLTVKRFVHVVPERARTLCRRTLGLMTPLLSSEIIAVAGRSVKASAQV